MLGELEQLVILGVLHATPDAYGVPVHEEIKRRVGRELTLGTIYKTLSRLEEKGMVMSGINEQLGLVEVLEIASHPYFIGCQYHPEFQSKPFQPHPLFAGFVKASLENRARKPGQTQSTPPPSQEISLPPNSPAAKA